MKTAQIDILSYNKKSGIYTVQYWDESHEGENNVEMQISEDSLLEIIPESEFYTTTLKQDREYLKENTLQLLQSYIQENS